MKGLQLYPLELRLTCSARVHYTLYSDKKTSSNDAICWGFLSRALTLSPLHIGYEWTQQQYLRMSTCTGSGVGPTLANRYLKLLKEAGVSQWFVKVPEKIQDFGAEEVFLKISTNYPAAMLVGLLEMYRNLLYHPMWCYYVVTLNKDHGFSPIESILACKLLYLNCSAPSADALSYSRYDKGTSYSYPLDVFSEKNILLCAGLWNRGSFRESPDFEGVYRFFNKNSPASSRRIPEEPLSLDVPSKYLCYLGDTETTEGDKEEAYIPVEALNKIKQFLRRPL